MSIRSLLTGLLAFFLGMQASQGADTLSVTIKDADRIFLSRNLLLLAGQYNIQTAEAQAVQARIYPNPVFTADLNAYDPQNHEAFHVGQTGEKAFAIEQLILMGGKRRTQVELARGNAQLATLDLEDVLRTLKFQLHSSLYTLAQQEVVLRRYRSQLQLLDTIIGNYEIQAKRGNIPVKEVVRLKAARLQLTNSRSEISHSHIEEMSKVRLLLRSEDYIRPVIDDSTFQQLTKAPQPEQWFDLALTNRPDLKAATLQTGLANLNLKYQRQLAVPDVAVNTSYDQRGGAFVNQMNVGFNVPLPLWNKNRGNILAAKVQTQAAASAREQSTAEVRIDVQSAFENMRLSIREYQSARQLYNSDFEVVLKGVSENFRKRNISLLEFVDFIESYNEAIAELQRVRSQLGIAAERVNYVTTSEVY